VLPTLLPPHSAIRASALALELREVHKTYRAGIPGCLARAEALRGIELRVCAGEVVGIIGERGAGKTTLLLCAAGLLRADRGTITRFGTAGGAGAAQAIYLPARTRPLPALSSAILRGARILLLDDALPALGDRAVALLRALARRGLAIIITGRELPPVGDVATRFMQLEGGRLHALPPVRHVRRVAEEAMQR
jgi:ABC-type multidrug transport system ATPase subunit